MISLASAKENLEKATLAYKEALQRELVAINSTELGPKSRATRVGTGFEV